MNVQIPVKWLQELLALCGPEDHELRERVMVSITAMDEQTARAVAMPEPDKQVKELMVLIGKYGSAVEANSTGNPSNYTLASDESAAYEAIKAKLRALLATGGQAQADKEMQLAMQEASSLAQSIFKRHYSDDEHYASGSVVWGLCDSLRGVISQIDNMTSGLVRSPQAQADARDAEGGQ